MIIGVFAYTANAQTIQGKATVQTSVTMNSGSNEDLLFGTISEGATQTVDISDNDANSQRSGMFKISGNALVTELSFSTLPSNLSVTKNSTTYTLPITFGTTDAGYQQASSADRTTGVTTFDPSNGVTGLTLDLLDNPVFVFIGGSVTASASQASGDYTGDITISATYN